MNERRLAVLFAAILTVLMVAAALLGRSEPGSGSSLSSRGRGWLLARRYAEEMGIETRLLDSQAARPEPDEVAFVVFPWQVLTLGEYGTSLVEHARRGGSVVIAYAGRFDSFAEHALLRDLGLAREDLPPPLLPVAWHSWATSTVRSSPTGEAPSTEDLLVRPMEMLPTIPTTATVWYKDEAGRPLVASLPYGRGRVILLPAEALSNGRIEHKGHAALLASLVDLPESRWCFDEFHHGLAAADSPDTQAPRRAVDLWLVHLLLVYALGVLALARRFGPPWTPPPITTGSTRSFFLGLGRLAARLGDYRSAAQLLVARTRELDPTLDLPALPAEPIDARGFVRYATTVAEAQKRRHS